MPANHVPELKNTGSTVIQNGDLSRYAYPSSIILLPSGKILVGGNNTLQRYHADGTLDTSFGSNHGYSDMSMTLPRGMALQSDGKILVSGVSTSGERAIALQRFDAEGKLDTSFGGTGLVRIDLGEFDTGYEVKVLADGRILVMGTVYNATTYVTTTTLSRLLANGSLDTGFGNGGSVQVASSGTPSHLFTLADGSARLLVSHSSDTGSRLSAYGFDADGRADPRVGAAGVVRFDPSVSQAWAATMQPDGKFIIANATDGVRTDDFAASVISVVRLNPDGSIDTHFGQDGAATLAAATFGDATTAHPGKYIGTNPVSLHLTASGQIVLAGYALMGNFKAFVEDGVLEREGQQLVWRLNANGTLDTRFGTDGRVSLTMPGFANTSLTTSALDAGGNIALGGMVDDGYGNNYRNFGSISRLDAYGHLLSTFANPTPSSNSIDYRSNYPAVVLNAHIGVSDADLAALADGAGNYAGATLTLARHGGANAGDLFSGSGELQLSAGHVLLAGIDIGAATMVGGSLALAFNANASQDRIDRTLRALSYQNAAPGDAGQQVVLDWTFNDGSAATSTFTTTVAVAAAAAPYWIETLLPGSARGIDAPAQRANYLGLLGPDKTVELYFPGPDAQPLVSSYRNYNALEQSYVWKAARVVESLTGLHFVAGDKGVGNAISFYSWKDDGHRAHSTYPGAQGAQLWAKFIAAAVTASDEVRIYTLLHELGHALGMQHPFDYQHDGPTLSGAEANAALSVMAYADSRSAAEAAAIMYSPFDIATLQYLYGVNPASRAGDDTYQLSATGANFIWDGAGTDTVSAAGLSQDLTLHLAPGYWDHLGPAGRVISAPGQVTINFGTQIENAVGGSGHDTITGNALANLLAGGGGNDMLTGGAGNDTLDGGAGTDSAAFGGRRADYELISQDGTLRVRATSGSDGTDLVRNTETLVFADTALPVEYSQLVQALYVAYFGRAADSAGLANFQSQLAAQQAPHDVGAFRAASQSSASLRALLDTFGTSTESQALYAGGTGTFVTAVYRNLFNRAPNADGLAFWTGEIEHGSVTRAGAALAIMAGALDNRTAQGLLDARSVQHKVDVAANFTFAIDSQAEVLAYVGDSRAANVRSMLAKVDAGTDVLAFQQTVVDTLAGLPSITAVGIAPPSIWHGLSV